MFPLPLILLLLLDIMLRRAAADVAAACVVAALEVGRRSLRIDCVYASNASWFNIANSSDSHEKKIGMYAVIERHAHSSTM
jgi:hypothetical protein